MIIKVRMPNNEQFYVGDYVKPIDALCWDKGLVKTEVPFYSTYYDIPGIIIGIDKRHQPGTLTIQIPPYDDTFIVKDGTDE